MTLSVLYKKTYSNGNKSKIYSYRGLKDLFLPKSTFNVFLKNHFKPQKNIYEFIAQQVIFCTQIKNLKAIKSPSSMKN